MKLSKLIFCCLLAVFFAQGLHAEGVTMAVVGAMYNTGSQTYRSLLDQRMQNIAWHYSVWTYFYGYIGGKKSMFDEAHKFGTLENRKPTGKPIEILQDFRHQGAVDMDIPVFYPLTGRGKSGSLTLVGSGERLKFAVKQVSINQQRHAILQQDTKMSKQVLQSKAMRKKLLRSSTDYLGDWFYRWITHQPYLTFLEGYSENLTKSKVKGGIAKQKQSHMNIYVAGSGKVAFSNTHGTYEAAVATAAAGLTNTSADWFSTDVIESMIYVASHNHRIQKTHIDKVGRLYIIVISDAQAIQLQQDQKWNERHLHAAERSLADNPLFTGRIAGVYAGALILIDSNVPSIYLTGDSEFSAARSTDGATTGVCYGTEGADGEPDFLENPVDPGPKKPAILFGASAIACGIADDISFEEEAYDFKQKIEIGADMIIGMQCADVIDTDGYFGKTGNKRHENTSSVLALTYSPSDAAW